MENNQEWEEWNCEYYEKKICDCNNADIKSIACMNFKSQIIAYITAGTRIYTSMMTKTRRSSLRWRNIFNVVTRTSLRSSEVNWRVRLRTKLAPTA